MTVSNNQLTCSMLGMTRTWAHYLRRVPWTARRSNPKRNKSWVFTGRTDAEDETSNTLATWCEELTHGKRPWCWERLKAGKEGDNRGWDGWMASLTQWSWVWVDSGSWWWTGRPGMLQSMGLQRVGHDWATELNWMSIDHLLHMQGIAKPFACTVSFSSHQDPVR